MRIHDISLPISESLVTWPGDPPIHITQPYHLDRGDEATVSRLDMSAHTGTHVDAPAHYIPGGSGVDELDLRVLVGPALVVHALEADVLSADVLAAMPIPPGTERVLFRTRNSAVRSGLIRQEGGFSEDFGAIRMAPSEKRWVAITEDGARWLVERGVRLVGIDYLSVGPYHSGASTHRTLLRAGVIPVEGLNLSGISAGTYQLVCLPLRIVGADGAPARAILIDDHRSSTSSTDRAP